MRVLFYSGEPRWSPASRAVLAAATGLAAREHQVVVASPRGSALNGLASNASIETVDVAATSTTGIALELRKVIRARFVEVVVVTTERDQFSVSSARLFADRGAVLRRVPSFEPLDVRRGGRFALKMAASGVIFTTEREANGAKVVGWTLPPAIAPLGVDAAQYDDVRAADRAEFGARSDGLLLACAYDLTGRYRIATMFRAVALLAARHDIRVVVFGPGSNDDELRLHASALGVGHLVTCVGDREDERAIVRAADAAWIVSSADAAAYACLDCMALRVPIVADRTPLTQHYVADGITGLLLTPSEPSVTASSVAAFLSSTAKRVAMGNAARTRVQREFPETGMVDGYERAVSAAGDRTQWKGAGS